MGTQALREFFKWCTIINVVLLLLFTLMLMVAGDFIYGMHGQFFHMSKEAFDIVIYALLGGYKILILVFNLVPYIALRIVRQNQGPAEP